MENYSAKNEDLEEVNYMLKRENEGLRDQTRMFMNEKSRYER
jgi:cell division protein FtsB